MDPVIDLAAMAEVLRSLPAAIGDAERIDRVRQLQALIAVCAAVQAETVVAFAASQRAAQQAAGVPAERAERGIGAQVGLALGESGHAGTRFLGWSRIVTTELPATFAELRAGRTSRWRTVLVARETAPLSRQQRALADAEVALQLADWGDRQVEAETRRIAYRLDPAAAVTRAARAATERRVTIRPAPETMAFLTLLLPCAQAVAAYAALTHAADTGVGVGDEERTRDQVMADTAVERLTGQPRADAVPVEIHLVLPADLLLDPVVGDQPDTSESVSISDSRAVGRTDPADDGTETDRVAAQWAELDGYGPIPCELARQLALGRGVEPRWIRRLYQHPGSGRLVSMETRRRLFTTAQRLFLRLRDRTCRIPHCTAPIRHADHVRQWAHGGATSLLNGRGTCEAHNHALQAPGWVSTTLPNGTITTVTPTGHVYAGAEPVRPVPAGPTRAGPTQERPRAA